MTTRPGERRTQILQSLAAMLEEPGSARITTAQLAARLDVSEAALYRHFASKAQMYDGLIEFVETTLFGMINRIAEHETSGVAQLRAMVTLLLGFSEKNRGMTRVLIGDALVTEDDRLKTRIGQLHDRVEASLRQSCRIAQAQEELGATPDAETRANALMSFVVGRWHQFAKSEFRRLPSEFWESQQTLLLSR